ncbi:MAG: DegT/DnrJ/EryC1/StrS family aminotransferase, partial [Acidimicrobiia bacterium]
YYSPPVHEMRAYRHVEWRATDLSVTNELSSKVLTLPMFDEMTPETVEMVAAAIDRIHRHAAKIRATLGIV